MQKTNKQTTSLPYVREGGRQSPGHWALSSGLLANGAGRSTLHLSLEPTKAYLIRGLL